MGKIGSDLMLEIFRLCLQDAMVGEDGTTAAAQEVINDAMSRWDQIVATAKLTTAHVSVALAALIDMHIRVLAECNLEAADGAKLYLMDAVSRAGDAGWHPLSKQGLH